MGDPKKQRRKYRRPSHPWQAARIEKEAKIVQEFGLKNKKELWKAEAILRNFKGQAKKLISRTDPQSTKEAERLLKKLYTLGVVEEGSKIDEVLGLEVEDILKRRLQTHVFKQGFAHSVKQARQFITHKHVTIGGAQVTVPSYMVRRMEESKIGFTAYSKLADGDHPERRAEKPAVPPQPMPPKGESA